MPQHIGLSKEQQNTLNNLSFARFLHKQNVITFSCQSEAELANVFAENAHTFIDYNLIEMMEETECFKLPELDQATQLYVSTKIAYKLSAGRALAQRIVNEYGVPQPVGYELETALHEAIANAIVHGNLGIRGSYDNLTDFDDFYTKVKSALEDKCRFLKKLMITYMKTNNLVSVMITDQGNGFDFTPIDDHYHTEKLSGNGRFLMKHYSENIQYHDGGSSVELQFKV